MTRREVTVFRGTFVDTPRSPFAGGHLRSEADLALVVEDGVIVAREPFEASVHGSSYVDLREGLVLPGFVDTHVHFPQVRAIGGLGLPLLDWLERCALPEEARLADATYAASVATDFVSGLVRAGTTTALVFGSHFASAVDALFTEATRVGLRVTSGLVLSDRILREDLFTTPDRAYGEGLELAKRWHGQGRTRYAVTPRFSLSCSDALMESAGALLAEGPDLWFTSHLNENVEEIEGVRQLFGCDYTTTYERAGLLGPRSVLAHNVHPTLQELMLLGGVGASVAHCPTSNAALGSGLFPLASHLALGVRVALGSDVGAGTGFSLFKEGLQAYFAQQLLGRAGHKLSSRHLLYLATTAGADVLGLSDVVGDFTVGKEFDALWLRPEPGSTLAVALQHADSDDDAVAKVFALATPADVAATWVAGELLSPDRSIGGAGSRSIDRWGRLPINRSVGRAPYRSIGGAAVRSSRARAAAMTQHSTDRRLGAS